MSKGGEVGEVEGLFSLYRTLDRTLHWCVRSVVVKWLGLSLLTGRWSKEVTGRTASGSGQGMTYADVCFFVRQRTTLGATSDRL